MSDLMLCQHGWSLRQICLPMLTNRAERFTRCMICPPWSCWKVHLVHNLLLLCQHHCNLSFFFPQPKIINTKMGHQAIFSFPAYCYTWWWPKWRSAAVGTCVVQQTVPIHGTSVQENHSFTFWKIKQCEWISFICFFSLFGLHSLK